MKKTLTIMAEPDTEYNFTVDVSIVDFERAEPENGIRASYTIAVEEKPLYIGTDCGNGQKFSFPAHAVFGLLEDEANRLADDIALEIQDEAQTDAAIRRWEEKEYYQDCMSER